MNATLIRELFNQARRGLREYLAIDMAIRSISPGTRPIRPGEIEHKRERAMRKLSVILDRIEGDAGAECSAADRRRLAEMRAVIGGNSDAG